MTKMAKLTPNFTQNFKYPYNLQNHQMRKLATIKFLKQKKILQTHYKKKKCDYCHLNNKINNFFLFYD